MIILFISTWPAGSGLTQATVIPHLLQLANDPRVEQVHFISMETHPVEQSFAGHATIRHHPITSKKGGGLLGKILDHRARLRQFRRIAAESNAGLAICRGAPAGSFGLESSKRLGMPFVVESFEPHADRMVDSGVWSRWGAKYLVQRHWERRIKRDALALVTVSELYCRYLIEVEHIDPARLFNVPCWVDENSFMFDADQRTELRNSLGIQNRTVAVYVGKFGGLYLDGEAFKVMRYLRDQLGKDLFLIILTPDDPRRVEQTLADVGIDSDSYLVDCVEHTQVSRFLSAADFALSFPRSTPWSFSCSPIKHAEYWACGLPVVLPGGVGDEANWVESEQVGALANMADRDSVSAAVGRVLRLLENGNHREAIRSVALARRGKALLDRSYEQILSRCQFTTLNDT